MTETSRSIIALFAATVILVILAGCNRQQQEVKVSEAPTASPPQDSPSARAVLAKKIMQSYTGEQFGADLAEQLDRIVGSEVLEEARVKFRQRMSERAFDAHRLQSLTEQFDTAELSALNNLLKTAEGKSAFRKLPAYWRKWGDKVSPVVYEVLTNAQEAPKSSAETGIK